MAGRLDERETAGRRPVELVARLLEGTVYLSPRAPSPLSSSPATRSASRRSRSTRPGAASRGVSILLRGTLADLKISSATSSGDQEFGDLFWGVGLFGEYRPWELVFVGASAKGYRHVWVRFRSGPGGSRGIAGTEWKFLSLEGGFRYIPYAESSSAGHSLHYDL